MVNHMSPEQSPAAAPKKTGLRRVNNVPLFILGGVAFLFIVVMVLVAVDRAKSKTDFDDFKEQKKSASASTDSFANEIAGNDTGGIVSAATQSPPEALFPPQEDKPAETPPAHDSLNDERPYRDESYSNADPEIERIKMEKLHLFQQAVTSGTSVPLKNRAQRAGGGIDTAEANEDISARIARLDDQIRRSDPKQIFNERYAMAKRIAGETGDASPLVFGGESSPGSKSYDQFDASYPGEDRWRLDSRIEAPISPYMIRAGAVIPAILIRGINSELPGQITAQIAVDVYDTATGRHMLLPQGGEAVGEYSSDVVFGQSRVLVAWQRITFPDGKVLDIGSMQGADSAGYSGFKDRVNNHYWRIYGSALLMSGVVAGVNLSQSDSGDGSDSQRASDAMSEALGQQLGQVTAQLIAKNMNIAPTLEIRPGYRFNIVVTKDLVLRPYRAFDY